MALATPAEGSTRLIKALPRRQRSSFPERSQSVDLEFGDVLCEPRQRFRHVYFPLGGYVSLRRLVDGGRSLISRLSRSPACSGAR